MIILKQYEIIRCKHYPPILAEDCLKDVLMQNRSKKYFLCSQVNERNDLSQVEIVVQLFSLVRCASLFARLGQTCQQC